jgi:malate dehydrogenase (oxaloacetate-decarboxylating)(NADP+)
MTTDKCGRDLLRDPTFDKSTPFTEAEKQVLGIVGLVPDVPESMELQLRRVMMQLGHKDPGLERYIYLANLLNGRDHNKYSLYNDMQGTAGIILSGMISAAKLKGTKLKDEKYLFFGAGSASIGFADLLCSALVARGMTLKDAQSQVYMFDINGLLESTRTDLVDFQKRYAHEHAPTRDFVGAIESIKPTTIIGVSAVGGAFTQKVIETMSRLNERPVVLALSSPISHAECTPEDAYTWSHGKAIYAAGVPFPPVHLNGQTFLPGQANNFHIYLGIGLAIVATQATRVTDEMFIEAAYAVAEQVQPDLLKQGLLYPLQANILEVNIHTTVCVAELAFDSGLARVERPTDLISFIRSHVSRLEYFVEEIVATKAA